MIVNNKKYVFSNEEIESIRQMRTENISIDNIARKFNCSNTPIIATCKKNDISTKRISLYDHSKIDGEIIRLYKEGKSSRDIEKIVGLNQCCIVKLLRKLGVERREPGYFNWDRKYTINENFFETIDTPEKAYILGLFYTDGCVHQKVYNTNNLDGRTYNSKNSNLSLAFIKSDDYLLKEVAKIMGSDRPIAYIKNVALLVLSSKKLCEDLIKLGCPPKKSLIIQFPTEKQVPMNLLPHFIRGLIDGDGWASTGRYRRLGINVGVCSGSLRFIVSLYHHMKYIYGIDGRVDIDKKPAQSQNRVTFNKKEDIRKLYDLCYKGASIAMLRKKNKIEEFFRKNDEHNIANPPATIIKDGVTYKRCYICMNYKILNQDNFRNNIDKYDRFSAECRDCSKKRDSDYHKRKREKILCSLAEINTSTPKE
jgi:hypothetical protein